MYTLDNYYITIRGKIMKQKAKKALWLSLSVIAIVIIIFAIQSCDGMFKETYVGAKNDREVTIVLNADDTFDLKVENLLTGTVTEKTGTYEKLGSTNSSILFKPASGSSFTCPYNKNLTGVPFITYNGVHCYKK